MAASNAKRLRSGGACSPRRRCANGCVAWCLSAPDLATSKYAAGLDKDAPFNRALARSQLVDENDLLRLAKSTPFRSPGDLQRVSARIRADFRAVKREIGYRRQDPSEDAERGQDDGPPP